MTHPTHPQEYIHPSPLAPVAFENSTLGEIVELDLAKLLSQRQEGLDIHYELPMRQVDGSLILVVPRTFQVVCPRCYGQGRSFSRLERDSEYLAITCPRCGGPGYLENARPIKIEVTPEMVAAGQIKLEGAGVYDHHNVRRGDLYIDFSFPNLSSEVKH
ncbi:MAG: hypothetical protein LBR11_02755 [Deltaproteobacteria bacterium]|jgi:DnaJ-class molecular chaperone|nr:hypothetical protein [Deltaproteobacteria bacterium]